MEMVTGNKFISVDHPNPEFSTSLDVVPRSSMANRHKGEEIGRRLTNALTLDAQKFVLPNYFVTSDIDISRCSNT